MEAAYVLRVTFRLNPAGVELEPDEFETILRVPAADPGRTAPTDAYGLRIGYGWRFFENVREGELREEESLREMCSNLLGVPVYHVSFRAFQTDEAYLAALHEELEGHLGDYDADDPTGVLEDHLGEAIQVR